MMLLSPTQEKETTGRRQHSFGAERRRGLRVRQRRPIKIFEPTLHRYFGGETQDLSATGLRIELPISARVAEGHLINVHVGLSDRGEALANRRQMIPARIVWANQPADATSGRIMVGLEFVSSVAAHLDAA
jgi:PilZ domain